MLNLERMTFVERLFNVFTGVPNYLCLGEKTPEETLSTTLYVVKSLIEGRRKVAISEECWSMAKDRIRIEGVETPDHWVETMKLCESIGVNAFQKVRQIIANKLGYAKRTLKALLNEEINGYYEDDKDVVIVDYLTENRVEIVLLACNPYWASELNERRLGPDPNLYVIAERTESLMQFIRERELSYGQSLIKASRKKIVTPVEIKPCRIQLSPVNDGYTVKGLDKVVLTVTE